MKKNTNKNNGYTFMFFPEGRGTPFTLRVHRYTLYLTVVSVLLIFAGLFVLIFKTGETALRLQMLHGMKQENVRLREYNQDLEISSEKIANIDSLAAYLYRLASISGIGDAPPVAPKLPAGAPSRPGAPVVDRSHLDEQPLVKTEVAETVQTVQTIQAAQTVQTAAAVVAAEKTNDRSAPPAQRGGVTDSYVEFVPNIMPVDGWITKHFSPNPADLHHGIDIAAATGTPIRATAMGVVEDVRNDRFFGQTVELRHENGFVTRYSHCSQVLVMIGEKVKRGQTIALVGNTGRSTAPHLHYEVIKNGKSADPMYYIGSNKH